VATVVAPGPQFRRLASNTLDGATLASMAVAGGSIYIRSATHLYRIGGERTEPVDVPDGLTATAR
jgi:hypothetical protein